MAGPKKSAMKTDDRAASTILCAANTLPHTSKSTSSPCLVSRRRPRSAGRPDMEMEERSALTAGGGAVLDAPAGAAACWTDGCGGGFGTGADMAAERYRRAAVLSQAITSSVVDLQINHAFT